MIFSGFVVRLLAALSIFSCGQAFAQTPPAAARPAAAASKPAATPALVLPANLAPAGSPAYVPPSKVMPIKAVPAPTKPKSVATATRTSASSATAAVTATDDASGARAVGKIVQTASQTPVRGDISAQKVVRDASGKEQFEPATNLVLGDIIQFNATFTNMNSVAIKFDPQISVPADTSLVPGSIQPPQGRLVKLASGDRVVWNVPHLPPINWVGASMRVRYERAADPVSLVVAGSPTLSVTAPPQITPTTGPIDSTTTQAELPAAAPSSPSSAAQ